MSKEFVWVEKYRPMKIDECILPESTKKVFKDFVAQNNLPNFLFAGTAGTGKTTVAYALCNEIGADVLYINASLENGIDTLRTKIAQFASTVSFSDGIKVVILDEADGLNANSIQPALRGFIEEFSQNCRFIFTCNHKAKIIEPIWSRCVNIDFRIAKEEEPKIMSLFFKRVKYILETENVSYDNKVVAELIKKYFPDFRRTINELQRYSVSGNIDEGIFVNLSEDNYKVLIQLLKEKKFTDTRNWVAQNVSGDGTDIFRTLYDISSKVMAPQSIPQLVLILSEYSYRAAFVADYEVNTMAALTEIMSGCQFN